MIQSLHYLFSFALRKSLVGLILTTHPHATRILSEKKALKNANLSVCVYKKIFY